MWGGEKKRLFWQMIKKLFQGQLANSKFQEFLPIFCQKLFLAGKSIGDLVAGIFN
jgi:hypothetical protein